jgi:hypothetical protein
VAVKCCRIAMVILGDPERLPTFSRMTTGNLSAMRSADGAGSETDGLVGLRFRCEERLGRLARVRDPATIIVATGMLLPVVEQELPRLFATRDIEASVETRA